MSPVTVLALVIFQGGPQEPAGPPSPRVARIWDEAPHSAFTDLVRHGGRFFCAFREGTGHVPGAKGKDGVIRVLASEDAREWLPRAVVAEEGVDLRDPKLSVTPDGMLMLLMGGSRYEGGRLLSRRTRVSFLGDDGRFGPPRPIELDPAAATDDDWLWRVTWRGDTGYGVVYRAAGDPWKTLLVRTKDGIRYEPVVAFELDGRPNETTLRFLPDGRMVAVVRNEEGDRGHVGTSAAPFREWSWAVIGQRLGGPDLAVLPDGGLLLGTRKYAEGRRTVLGRLALDGRFDELVELPSGGDTSYPGLLVDGDTLFVSYYSSHEGKSSVYLARIALDGL